MLLTDLGFSWANIDWAIAPFFYQLRVSFNSHSVVSFVFVFPHDFPYSSEHGLYSCMDPENVELQHALVFASIVKSRCYLSVVCKYLWFEQLKSRQALAIPLTLTILRKPHSKPRRPGDIAFNFHSGKKFQSQWLTIPMDFATKSVCALTVYMYLYQYSLTLVNMNKPTNDGVAITGQVHVC